MHSVTFTACAANSAIFCRQPPQGGTGVGAVGNDADLGNPGVAAGDHRGDRPGLGAGAFGIGHVFHVAADIDMPEVARSAAPTLKRE